eukprot:4138392-Prymnesium_polylepis.2
MAYAMLLLPDRASPVWGCSRNQRERLSLPAMMAGTGLRRATRSCSMASTHAGVGCDAMAEGAVGGRL